MKPTKTLQIVDGWHIRYDPDSAMAWDACKSEGFFYLDTISAWTYWGIRFAIWNRVRRERKARTLEEVTRPGSGQKTIPESKPPVVRPPMNIHRDWYDDGTQER